MKIKNLKNKVVALAILTIAFGIFGCAETKPKYVMVTFEIQLINADANYGYGIVGGHGTSGTGAVNEVIRESFYATVGEEVFIKVYGGHWDRNDPAHQVVCRIIVDSEEIYIGADQGTTTKGTEVYIHGPVYIPQKDNN